MIKIGVLCPSEIAYRRFMPALQKSSAFSYVGIGVASSKERFGEDQLSDEQKISIRNAEMLKASSFQESYGGKIFESYDSLLQSEIDAVYIPLPPALHFEWAKKALSYGKHVLVEKPATISYEQSAKLVQISDEKNLALHENYMFVFHDQLDAINQIVNSGKIGDKRLISLRFGFPFRSQNDFRYQKNLGGGALIDAGGYTIRYASELLGPSLRILGATLTSKEGFDVDLFGSAMGINDQGIPVQLSFGMDNQYKCEIEIWGSKGTLHSGRVFTAPVGFESFATVTIGNEVEKISLPADDAFYKSISFFASCIENKDIKKQAKENILRQAKLVDELRNHAEA